MHNRKVLSALLAILLVSACVVGVLMFGAEAANRTVPVDFEGYETIADALDAVAAKEDWADNEYANIILADDFAEEVTVDENGILFGVDTIFVNGERLPITISGGTLTLPAEQTGNVVCSNSYTFKAMNFYLADKEVTFWAGSGEVVLDTVALSEGTNALATFYADCPTAAAFEGWTDPGEDKIHTSLEFKNINYTKAASMANIGCIGHTADFAADGINVTASDLSAELILTDAKVKGVRLRTGAALSPVSKLAFTMNASSVSATTVAEMGVDASSSAPSIGEKGSSSTIVYPDFEIEFNMNGGTITSKVCFINGVKSGITKCTVNLKEGTKTNNNFVVQYNSGTIAGTFNVSGGTHKALYGFRGAGSENNISGGTITTFQGARLAGTATNNVSGGTITTFYGSYSTSSANSVTATNNITGGTITDYYGTGKASNVGVVNNISGGEIGTFHGTANHDSLTRAVTSGNGGITNNITGGTITGDYYGTGNSADASYRVTFTPVKNYLSNVTILGNYCGSGILNGSDTRATPVYNQINAGTIIHGDFIGQDASCQGSTSADYLDNQEGAVLEVCGVSTSAWKLMNEINGGEIKGGFLALGPSRSGNFGGSVVNLIRGGQFCTSKLGEDANDTFIGISNGNINVGGTGRTIILGGTFCKGFEGINYRPATSSGTSTILIAGGTFGAYQGVNDFVGADGGAYYANVTKNAQGGIIAVNGAPYVTDVVVTEEVTTYTAVAEGATLDSTVQYYTFDGENYAEYTVTGEEGAVAADTYFTKTVTPATYVTYDEANPLTEAGNKELFDSIMATARVFVGDYKSYAANLSSSTIDYMIINVDDDIDATAPIVTKGDFICYNNESFITDHPIDINVVSGKFDADFYCVGIAAGYAKGDHVDNFDIEISGGTFNNLIVAGGSLGHRYNGKDYMGTATLNMTGGKVTGNLYAWHIPVILDENGLPSADNVNYSTSTPGYYGNIIINIEGPVDVDRDDMNTAEGKAKLINIANIDGHIDTGDVAKSNTYLNETRQHYKGNLTYNLKNVYISNDFVPSGAARQSGNVSASLENVLVRSIRDVSGNTPSSTTTRYNGHVTGDISLYLKNCHVTYQFQWLNRSGCCGGDFTLELDSLRGSGNVMREMNTATGSCTVYVYGDIRFDESSKIQFARDSKKNVVHIGAKLVDGVITPVPTTITGPATTGIGNTYDDNVKKTGYCTMHIYDITLKGGTKIDFGARNAGTNVLHGDIALFDGSTVAATKVDADVEEIIVTVDDAWASETAYVTLTTAADVAKLYGKALEDSATVAVKDTENGALLGGGTVDIAVSASLTVSDRIYINMFLDQDGVDAYLAAMVNAKGEHALDYSVVIDLATGAYFLGEGSVTAANLVDGSYKVQAGAVAASNFDKDITFQGKVFSATSNILDIAQSAVEAGVYTEVETDLFKAIYNYGASVLGLDMYEDFSEGFAITEGAKPVHQNGNTALRLQGIGLLMGDAMGIQLKAQLAEDAALPTLSMKVKVGDGEAEDVDAELFRVLTGKNGEVYINVYVSADYAEEDITFFVYADGETAFAARAGLQDYTAYVSGNGAAELACAQLIQAVVNY